LFELKKAPSLGAPGLGDWRNVRFAGAEILVFVLFKLTFDARVVDRTQNKTN
jgi:hypothetical protein